MNVVNMRSVLMVCLTLIFIGSAGAADLKAYYETQKAEITPTFIAPQLGSEVTIELLSGRARTGILMKLDANELTLMSADGKSAIFKRAALKESSRARFFAADYAHVKAMEKTRAYKQQLLQENLAQEAANTHEARLSVSPKLTKSNRKAEEVTERELKQTGEKRRIVTTTRTDSETLSLNISVANTTTHPDTYTIDYYFFSKSVAKGDETPAEKKKKKKKEQAGETEGLINNQIRLKSKSSRSLTVPARSRESISIASEPFEVQRVEIDNGSGYSGNRAPRITGTESAGYLVVLKHGTTVLDRKASARSYLDEEWLSKIR